MAAHWSIFELMTSPFGSEPELQSQNRVDVDYEKTFGLGAYLTNPL